MSMRSIPLLPLANFYCPKREREKKNKCILMHMNVDLYYYSKCLARVGHYFLLLSVDASSIYIEENERMHSQRILLGFRVTLVSKINNASNVVNAGCEMEGSSQMR